MPCADAAHAPCPTHARAAGAAGLARLPPCAPVRLSRSTLAAVLAAALVPVPAARLRAQPPTAPPRDTMPVPRDSAPPRAPRRRRGTAPDSAVALPSVQVTGTRGRAAHYAVPDAGSATRTPTPLLQTPQAVQVLDRTLLEEQDRRTLADALVNVSGVTPTRPEETLFIQPIVRGFPAEIFLDGLPAFGTTAFIDPTSLVGTERVEVVKGPTSTVYGGGAGAPLGGLINVVSTRPEADAGGVVGFRTGRFATVDPYADLNVPFGARVAARLAGEYQRNTSWIDHVAANRWSVQPSLSAELSPTTELLVRGQFDRRSQLEYSGMPAAQALAGQLGRDAFPGATTGQPRTTVDNRLATAELRHAFRRSTRGVARATGDDVHLTVSGRSYDGRIRDYGSFVLPEFAAPDPATPTAYPIFTLYLPTRVKEGTLDANLSATADALGGRHVLLGGVNYDHTAFSSAIGFDGVPVGVADLAGPSGPLAFGAIPAPTTTQTNRYATVAAYGQDQATYGPLHLSGSLRYTQLQLRQQEQAVDRTYRRLTPRAGATVDMATGVALFAGYATGFRAPVNFVGRTPPKPETSRSAEGGLKLALARLGLSGTLAAFDMTRRNVSTPDPGDPMFAIQTGEQRARGVEADVTWEPTRRWSLIANYAYTEAAVTRDPTIPVGNRLPRVPRNSGRVAARYRVLGGAAKGLAFGAGVTAFGAREITLPNTVPVPGYAAVDAQAAYDVGRFTAQLSAVNLAGRRAFDAFQYLASPVVIPAQPRAVYVTLKARL